MFEFIKGEVSELTPTAVILELNGLGYEIQISLYSYSSLQKVDNCRMYVHQVIREDAHILYGFVSKEEREIFRLLISVSGVGANTARVILSSMSPQEVRNAISSGNDELLRGIKGIGVKSAQRIIVDLKDKVGKVGEPSEIFRPADNTNKKEALSALEVLGFSKKQSEKIVDKLLSVDGSLSVEELIKQALKLL